MGIVDEDVARVKAAVDFVQVASEHMALKKVGRRWVGLCPFHAEKSPSFSVNAEEGLYHCFGCQASGDVIKFVREIDHLDFVEAVERLAGKAGIQLRYDDATEGRDREKRNRLFDAMEKAVAWYHERLLTAPDAAAARGYLRSRGYDGDVVRRFKIGWAPDDWDALAKALRLPEQVLKDTGLGFMNRRGRQQDSFRARVMFPIFDVGGKPVAFGGRILPGADGPKYKNSPETPIYSKSRTLYALNWAKQSVVEHGEVVVCEGYTDVIGFFEAGVPRAVATCGTALAEEHFRTLKKFAPRVVLAYDADTAGQAAAERFYAWERQYDMDVAVAAFPSGKDPGDVARTDPDALKIAIEEAKPFLAFRLDRVLDKADMRSPEVRARTAEAALAVIAEHPSELVRDQYVMQVADRCRIDPDRLRDMARGGPRVHPGRAQVARPDRVRPPEHAGPEIEALRLAVHRPETVAHRIEDVLFAEELHRAAFAALASATTLHDAIESADPAAAALLHRLAVEEPPEADPDDVVARLADRAATRVLHELEAEARTHPDRIADLSPVTGWLRLSIEELREPASRVDASARLVAWLVEASQGE
ncbi:MAG TPA: DNA primase [Acidimicrobiales bacterium]|nr:DNA primase [Acidimicrobiales bacterium]